MHYIYKQVNDTYVVWLAEANRYLLLDEPAFRVMEDWALELPEGQIICNCALEFRLGLQLARRFVKQVTHQLQTLGNHHQEDYLVKPGGQATGLPCPDWFSTRYYSIHGRSFRFRFGDPGLEALIHPGFGYLVQPFAAGEAVRTFDLWRSDNQLLLQTGGLGTWRFPACKRDQFVGQVCLQLLNGLNDLTDAHWMGAVHASAVKVGQGAVLLTAPPGSGKSTLAALLMKRGYQVLSDDFSPLSLHTGMVYPFPEGISVKKGSLKALQSCFPSLVEMGEALPDPVREVHLPLSGEAQPAPVRAIVFLQYDPKVELEFEALTNLEAMDAFMRQLWLTPTSRVAAHFMDWYFGIPCYKLHYSHNEKAINCLSKRLQ